MKVEQLYTGCLAEAAYYIESDGEVAIVDPLRESAPYIQKAEANGARIKYILETHFHADFVSGHVDLAHKTGATIVFGPGAEPAYAAHVAKDGEELQLGKIKIKVLHTPGHTMESSCFLIIDENGKANSIVTGDTLFIGDVGRPDLVQKLKAEITPEILAGKLFDSLRNKVMTLPDDVIVYPGHGKGSACGKNMCSETTDTLGHQKATNYALRADMTREEFIKTVTDGLVSPPQYFPQNVLRNIRGGIDSMDHILQRSKKPLTAEEFLTIWETLDAVVIDTRTKEEYANEYIPGTIFIGLDDNFASWVGTLVNDLEQPILLITKEGREEEAITRLSRVGYDNAMGYLNGGIAAWKKANNKTESLEEISATDFAKLYNSEKETINLIDGRRNSEYESEHIKGAVNFPLDFVNSTYTSLDKSKRYYIHCAGGFRSVVLISILKKLGFTNLVNIKGGYKELSKTDLEKTEYHQQLTML